MNTTMPNVYLKDFELSKPQKLRSLFQVEELNKVRSNVDNLKYLFGGDHDHVIVAKPL